MAMTWLTSLILGQFSVVDVPPVSPPPPPEAIHQGAKTVSFGLWQPGAALSRPSGSIGGSFFVTDRVALGLQVKADVDRITVAVPSAAQEETLTQFSVGLVPSARLYLNPKRPVASYLSLALSGGYVRLPELTAGNTQVGTGRSKSDGFLDILGAFGAEWFVVPAVSLSGELGFSLQAIRPNDQKAPSFHTLSSLVQANFYW